MEVNVSDPEIGTAIETCGYLTNVHDQGEGKPVVLLHGSGAGVSAWANWRNLIPKLSDRYRVLAPDLAGFGYTEIPASFEYRFMETWIEQLEALLDALGVASALGCNFGGALALWMAALRPDLYDRLVLMGPGGWPTK